MSKTELRKLVRLAQITEKYLRTKEGVDWSDFEYYHNGNTLAAIMDMISGDDYYIIEDAIECYTSEDNMFPIVLLMNIDIFRLNNGIIHR